MYAVCNGGFSTPRVPRNMLREEKKLCMYVNCEKKGHGSGHPASKISSWNMLGVVVNPSVTPNDTFHYDSFFFVVLR